MDKASRAVRRSSVRLLTLGGGHSDLSLLISEVKDMRNTAKAFMTAQNSAAQFMLKWAGNEENRAIQDVAAQLSELNLVWTEVQKDLSEHLKQFRQMFETILDGEKHVSQAKNNLAVCEARETKARKELKKAAKKATSQEIQMLEQKLTQAERAKDLAHLEVTDKVRENEVIKLMHLKEGMLQVSEAYIDFGKKCSMLFEAQRDISYQLPDVHGRDYEDIKYTGSGAAKFYVQKAKENVRRFNEHSVPNEQNQITEEQDPDDDPPPPYSEADYLRHCEAQVNVPLEPPADGYTQGSTRDGPPVQRAHTDSAGYLPSDSRVHQDLVTEPEEGDELSGAMGAARL